MVRGPLARRPTESDPVPALWDLAALQRTALTISAFHPAPLAEPLNRSLDSPDVLTSCANTMCAEVAVKNVFKLPDAVAFTVTM